MHPRRKEIPGFTGYWADELGNIYSDLNGRWGRTLTPHLLRQYKDKRGYGRVGIGGQSRLVSRLVLLAFRGVPAPEMQCCHGVGGVGDNSLPNLRWGTAKENEADKKRDGTDNRGSRHPRHKINEEQAREIFNNRGRVDDVAREYGMSRWAVYDIWSGRNWGWLNRPG